MTRNAKTAQTITPSIVNFFYVNPAKPTSISTAFLTREVTASGAVRYFYTNRRFETIEVDRDFALAKRAEGYFTDGAAIPSRANVDLSMPKISRASKSDAPEVPADF